MTSRSNIFYGLFLLDFKFNITSWIIRLDFEFEALIPFYFSKYRVFNEVFLLKKILFYFFIIECEWLVLFHIFVLHWNQIVTFKYCINVRLLQSYCFLNFNNQSHQKLLLPWCISTDSLISKNSFYRIEKKNRIEFILYAKFIHSFHLYFRHNYKSKDSLD